MREINYGEVGREKKYHISHNWQKQGIAMAENFLSGVDLPENYSSAFQDDKDEIIALWVFVT